MRSCRVLSSAASVASAGLAGPLEGVRIVDMTRILAGPFATQLLGDMGADVIKIEALNGDDTRTWGPPFIKGASGDRKQSAYFISCNRNKRSIALDVKSDDGRQIVYDLVKEADVFVENFLPGKLASMGLGYPQLSAINPRLIYGSISGWGDDGPYAQRPGYDVGISAAAGLMSITGHEDGEPAKVGVALTDISTGLYMHGAILSSLFAIERQERRTGKPAKGLHLTTSLLEAGISNLANVASNVLNASWPTRRWGTQHESIVPYQAFKASDGWLIVAAMNDAQFQVLCKVAGLASLGADPRFTTNADRVKHRKELLPLIQEALLKKSRQEWIEVFSTTSVTVTPVNSVAEALQDPQVASREMVVPLQHEALGREVKVTGLPVKYKGSTGDSMQTQDSSAFSYQAPPFSPSIRRPPPLLGENTVEILRDVLGRSEGDIERLLRKGVVKALA